MHTVTTSHHPQGRARRVLAAVPVRPLGGGLCLISFAVGNFLYGIPNHVPIWYLALIVAIALGGVEQVVSAVVLTVRGVRRGRR